MEQYRKSPRALFLDYDSGVYFITICTHNMKHYFGEINNAEMKLSDIGLFTENQLLKCNEFYPYLDIPLFVVMPNHIHFIISIKDNSIVNSECQRTPNPMLRSNPIFQRHIPILSKYISSLKGSVSKYAKSIEVKFGWQSRYHDHLIRGFKDGKSISEYIMNNVARWKYDCFNK